MTNMTEPRRTSHRRLPGLIACGLAGGLVWGSQPAAAGVFIGFGFPLFVGPPAYYPPPVYYPPPPYYPPPANYAPPAYYPPAPSAPPAARSCVTSGTVCPMERPVAVGASCYCTTAQGRSWGRAG
jgi:hypothetical protein